MAYCSLSDAELWDLIVNDDHHAFTIMFQRHWLRLYKSTLNYVKDSEASEEIIHDLFLNIWNRRKCLVINDFGKYFTAATRYQLYAHLKKNKPVVLEYRENISEESNSFELNYAYEKISARDLETRLSLHLRSLPERCQEIFFLSRVQQLDNSEIAEKLGISKRTVENQISRALQCIRFNLKDIVISLLLISTALLS